ncbi:hypothetical protein [Pseudomonas leptonychotis]|nr:hypothetical protein [Pseudomonas leptonychotis]
MFKPTHQLLTLIIISSFIGGCAGPRGNGKSHEGEPPSEVCVVKNNRVREETFATELIKALQRRNISPTLVNIQAHCNQSFVLKYSGRHSVSSAGFDMPEIDLELFKSGELVSYSYWNYKEGQFDTIDLKGGSVFSYKWKLEEALDGLFGLREIRNRP